MTNKRKAKLIRQVIPEINTVRYESMAGICQNLYWSMSTKEQKRYQDEYGSRVLDWYKMLLEDFGFPVPTGSKMLFPMTEDGNNQRRELMQKRAEELEND